MLLLLGKSLSWAAAGLALQVPPSASRSSLALNMSQTAGGGMPAGRESGGVALNVLGMPLKTCSLPGGPTTGWRRDGFCNTDEFDSGNYCVCSELTTDFLDYTKAQGNDLSTPRGQFPGLKAGDRWCLCSSRWLEAQKVGKAPKVVLESTHEKTLNIVPLELLMEHSAGPPTSDAEL